MKYFGSWLKYHFCFYHLDWMGKDVFPERKLPSSLDDKIRSDILKTYQNIPFILKILKVLRAFKSMRPLHGPPSCLSHKGSRHNALAHTSAHRLLQLVGPFWGYGKRKQRDNKLLNRSEFVQFNVLNYMK